jgi:DNA-binding winged helix-turn-helix (wHTH) protein/tetratricopeptide (TPR) repeat protein
MRVGFADVLLDAGAMELVRAGARVAVEPQVMEVLIHLVTHRERVVLKTELLDEIWGDRFVSESALSSRIKSARQAIGDNGRDQRLIRTIHGRGFRFVGEVVDLDGRPTAEAPSMAMPSPTGADRVDWAPTLSRVAAGAGVAVALQGSGPARREAVDDLVRLAEDAGLLTCRGRGAGELRVFGSVVEALDELVSRWPHLLAGLPAPCRVELDRVLGGDPPSVPQRLFVAARELVSAGARAGGVVVAIEDVHLIDRGTAELLHHLVRGVRGLPVLLVATHPAGFDVGLGLETVQLVGDVPGTDEVPVEVRAALERIAVLGEVTTVEEALAATGLEAGRAQRVLDLARGAGFLVPAVDRVRFSDPAVAEQLARSVSAAERQGVLRRAADQLAAQGASAARIADRLLDAGDRHAAAPHQLQAVTEAAQLQLHAEVLARTSDIAEDLEPGTRQALLELRADALSELGDLEGIRCYRAALRLAGPDADPWLRARLARAFIRANDVESARAALSDIDLETAEHPGVRLIGAMVHYLRGELGQAERLVAGLRDVALAPGAPGELLEVISVQGMLAHSRGEWFDRLRMELRLLQGSGDLARTVFDVHHCVAQYLLYGPTGHQEVIQVARDLYASAEELGAEPAMAFAVTLEGEARLLSGDLVGALANLEQAVERYRSITSDTGLAHALQRLAEVKLHLGDRAESVRLLQQALPLARWSPLSQHLLQRIYGTLVEAAATPAEAAAVADDALATLDHPEACKFCQVMVAVPAANAYSGVGRFDDARTQIEMAARFAARWEGPAWPAAVTEAEAMLARAEGRDDDARALLEQAARGFDEAGQPLDAARCREA